MAGSEPSQAAPNRKRISSARTSYCRHRPKHDRPPAPPRLRRRL